MAKQDVHRIRLNALASFDVVWDPDERSFVYVFVERGGVQKRVAVTIPMDQAAGLIRFQLDRMNNVGRRPSRISDIGPPKNPFPAEITEVGKKPPSDDDDDLG